MSSSSHKSGKSGTSANINQLSSRNSSLEGEIRAVRSPLDGASLTYEEARANLTAAETGYQPELRRNFSTIALLGVGFGLTNSWIGISGSLVTGISSGGPMLVIYGILILASIAMCYAVSLSELASAMPNAGGQYYWTSRLAPEKYAPFASYLCGTFGWLGAIFTSVSICVLVSQIIVAAYYMGTGRTDSPPTWVVFVIYEIINLLLVPFNLWEKHLPMTSQIVLYASIVAFIVITITVLAKSSGNYQTAEFVFAEFSNGTGWSSSGMAFIVGLISPSWAFSALDAATHLAEETLTPETDIPKVIVGTVIIGFVTSFIYSLSMFFSIRDLDEILNSVYGVPVLDIYHQAVGSRGGAVALVSILGFAVLVCIITSHTWQARLAWSFARDNGLPGSRFWSRVGRTGVPVNAHLMSCALCALIGCIYMASTTAYDALITACVTFLLMSWSVPVIFLLMKGRDNIEHGPFWMGKIGLVCNVVSILWTVFALVVFSLPSVMPVTATNMNYSSVVLVGFTTYAIVYWVLRGHKKFKTIKERAEMIPQLTAIASIQLEEAEDAREMKF